MANAGATAYEGPITSTPFTIGGTKIQLARPADPDLMLEAADVQAWNARDDYMPYWAYLWPGSYMLADCLGRTAEIGPGVTCLEIGCGLGLAGLKALAMGASVHFTDYDSTALAYVARSIEESGLDATRATFERLDWRDLPADRRYQVILGADVLYERRLVPLVANLLARMLEPGGLALLAGPYRVATKDLPEALKAEGLVCEVADIEIESPELGPLRGELHTVRRRTVAMPSEPI
ncbi:methyltransferase domain-containing protein [Isosphaeraceae bacterium EP7]